MTAKRFTIKPQDDYFGIVDNYSADKICVINGIRTEIEAEWLCKDMNALNDENEQLKQFKEDVFNKIDMHLRMLPTARDNEFDEDDGDPSLYVGAIYMLETLKKELEE